MLDSPEKKKKVPSRESKSKTSPGTAGGKAGEEKNGDWAALPQRRPRDRTRRERPP